MITKLVTICTIYLFYFVSGNICIQESSERTGTEEISVSDIGTLYSDEITSNHQLAKIDVMTRNSGELTGI